MDLSQSVYVHTIDPSAVADSWISLRIIVCWKSAEKKFRLAEIATKNVQPEIFLAVSRPNLFCAWQLQICFRIVTDVMMTSDILIVRLIKLYSANVVWQTWLDLVFFIKVNLWGWAVQVENLQCLYITSYCLCFQLQLFTFSLN